MLKLQKSSKLFLFIFIFLLIIPTSTVNAAKLHSYKFIANVNDDGSADVVTEWIYEDDAGTEHYVPVNKEGIKISNLKVKRNGVEYKTLSNWYVDASFEDKANKAGLNDVGDEVEICWGIGKYGHNTYEVSYHIDGFVKSLNDSQMIHYRLFNDDMSEAPEKAEYIIKRSNGEPFGSEVGIWAFGFEGETYIEDGNIIGVADEKLFTNNYMHTLVQLPLDTFNVKDEHYLNKDFEDFKEVAFFKSDYLDEYGETPDENMNKNKYSEPSLLFRILTFIFPVSVFLAIFYQFAKILPNEDFVNFNINKGDYKKEYYSKKPYDGDISEIYFILSELNMTSPKNMISYYLLKWIREGVLVKEDVLQDGLFKKDKVRLKIIKEPSYNKSKLDAYNPEEMLFKIVKEAAMDGYLDEGEFDIWMKNRHNQIEYEKFKEKMDSVSEDLMFSEGYVYRERVKKKPNDHYITRLSPYGKEIAVNSIKFENYLKDYSLLNERSSMNVHVWDELMLYAAVLGIAQEVKREFNKISPDYENLTSYSNDSITTSLLIGSTISNSYVRSTQSSSRSSGGGGSSSIGGGGGGFGGSSGGGTR